MAASLIFSIAPNPIAISRNIKRQEQKIPVSTTCLNSSLSSISNTRQLPLLSNRDGGATSGCFVLTCLPSSSSPSKTSSPKTRLYVSGLSFHTTEESLQNAFQNFGQLVEVNLVMDKIANRPRGFAFLRYATEDDSQRAIEGMHGKFLDGRVIFVEVAKPRSELRGLTQNPRHY